MVKNFIKLILKKISRVIYYIIPDEFKKNSKLGLKSKINDELVDETFNHFKEDFKKSVIFNDTWKFREYAIKHSLLNDKEKKYTYLEFGVWKGESANFFSRFIDKIYCFDSFEGLKDDWVGSGLPKDALNLNKKIPKLNSNVEPIIGWVENSLDDFLKKRIPKINFVHMDLDTYNSTKFVLLKIKPFLLKNATIVFDQFYHYPGWEQGEYKALKEVFNEDEFKYLAFRIYGKECAIQLK